MSVYIVKIHEHTRALSAALYAVEADTLEEAYEYALGAHAIEERVNPNDCEVMSVEKTSIRHVLQAEKVIEENA
jgi:hypothetical protein